MSVKVQNPFMGIDYTDFAQVTVIYMIGQLVYVYYSVQVKSCW